jgi:hypothetical protein
MPILLQKYNFSRSRQTNHPQKMRGWRFPQRHSPRHKPHGGEDMVATRKAGRAAAACGCCVYTILRTALAVRIKTRVGMRIPNGMRDMVVVGPPMAAAAMPALP